MQSCDDIQEPNEAMDLGKGGVSDCRAGIYGTVNQIFAKSLFLASLHRPADESRRRRDCGSSPDGQASLMEDG